MSEGKYARETRIRVEALISKVASWQRARFYLKQTRAHALLLLGRRIDVADCESLDGRSPLGEVQS
jgi:hypothetical protein